MGNLRYRQVEFLHLFAIFFHSRAIYIYRDIEIDSNLLTIDQANQAS